MKLNNKGLSMVELIVSVALISIVLIFLMNLFLQVRSTYNRSNIQSEYEILQSNIVNAVSSDIVNYGLNNVECNTEPNTCKLTFNTIREKKYNEYIKKQLKIYSKNSISYISYTFITDNNDTTSDEKITNVVRQIPTDAILGNDENVKIIFKNEFSTQGLIELKIPISNQYGNIYDINIYGLMTN